MKKPIPLLLFLLAAWIIGMSVYQSNSSCACNASAASTMVAPIIRGNALTIQDKTHAFIAATSDNISFNFSDFALKEPVSDKIVTVFKQVADYLNAHADRSILLTGLYSNKEQNSSILPNLGLARAQSVKEILLDLGCPKKQIGVGAAMNQLSSNQTLLGGIHYSFTDTPITK